MIPVEIIHTGTITVTRTDGDSTKTQADLDRLGLVLASVIEAFAGEAVEVNISANSSQAIGPITV